jgi:hypothetical protein
MTTLVIGDIHTKEYIVDQIIANHPHDRVVLMGDYFDDFHDTADLNRLTACWLREKLYDDRFVCLMGNHDIHYASRDIPYCSGYTMAKFDAINQVLTPGDWKRLQYLHVEQGWWCSHAGVTEHWFAHPVEGVTEAYAHRCIAHDVLMMESGQFPLCLYAADHYRGGSNFKGGILWNDWRNLDIIPGVPQIVGHTPHDRIQHRHNEHGEAYCVDALTSEYISITNGNITIHQHEYH